jgi:predicted transcriptional regulator YdeE
VENIQILEFGPFEVAGVSYIGKNEAGEIPALWNAELFAGADPAKGCFGICRCVPGRTDGTFEYIAAIQPRDGAESGASMPRLTIPRGVYAVFGVPSLAEIKPAWQRAAAEVAELKGWEPYCGKEDCECATHPSFEYYAPGFCGDGRLEILMPLRRRG